ncbi:acyl-CoA dehydrogenase family protein [Amycolatopsis umgeniensis]|uniref:Alkylation response protein AidB-like acyl-CoA dehydrogenase n=1 Tax=Amycolatopsis umgeniensis TaxID=336628 RepID=A0A841BDW2_9PSEU|nr:acyl-CoA dehydrogenase family protein [Amycolatopsis umgeniensis]MBB5857527.1 alkylation response protein AidB-like acyl-CoA dehydrogenase [Amycolatopsis umgeniensis]
MTNDQDAAAVLKAVRDIVPRLRENGHKAEDARWIPDENVELLDKAGVFQLATPARFGGLDLPLADQFEILAEIARGCGSTGWVAMAWVSTAWLATQYPDKAQEEIFANPSVRISGGFSPTGTVERTEGGYNLNGTWRFNSGCRGAHWDLLGVTLEEPDGQHRELYVIVPMSELSIADDWHVSAAAATGSSSTTANDVFVPAHRVIDAGDALFGLTGDRSNTGATGRNYGLIGFVMTESVASYVGMARAAYELFVSKVGGKPIAYTPWEDQAEHPLTQLKVSLAANKIAAAEALVARWITLLQQRADAGEQPTVEEKATGRGQCGYAIQLAKEAVEELQSVSSGSAIMRNSPFQRFFRDIEGLALHGMMTPNSNLEVHGRVELGLDPNTYLL